jgi:two-component system response regulator RegA
LSSPPNLEKRSILIIDDNEVFRTRLGRAFESRNWEVSLAAESAEALTLASETAPDLAIVDLRIASEDGLELVPRLREIDTTMSIIMLTGYGSIATALEAIKRGADHYLTKPVDADQILTTFESLQNASLSPRPPDTVPSLARVEWEHIQRVLTDCGGNVTQAAKTLGLHRRSLQRKLSRYAPRL